MSTVLYVIAAVVCYLIVGALAVRVYCWVIDALCRWKGGAAGEPLPRNGWLAAIIVIWPLWAVTGAAVGAVGAVAYAAYKAVRGFCAFLADIAVDRPKEPPRTG